MIVCQNLYLQCTHGQCLGKISLVRRKLSNISHGWQTWFKLCVIICEIDIKNFIKVLNNFNFFEVYMHFSIHNYKFFHTNLFW
jgi:hypothetical protein